MNIEITLLKYITYFPFIGWMLPLGFLYKDKSLLHHVKNALIMAVFFGALLILFSFSTIYIYEDYRMARFITIIFSLIFYGLYIILCIAGTVFIVQNKELKLPLIQKLAEKINI